MQNLFAWINYIGTGLILALAVWLIIWLNVYAASTLTRGAKKRSSGIGTGEPRFNRSP